MKMTNLASCMIACSLATLASAKQAANLSGGPQQESLKILTQNVYVGSDILSILRVDDPRDIPTAVGNIYKMIQSTNFSARAEKLAELVEINDPDVISLQEISLIKRQSPGDFLAGNPRQAEDVIWDYLEILLTALENKGMNYRAASVNEAADIEVPMLLSYSPTETFLDDVRLQDRDIILVKQGTEVSQEFKMTFVAQMTAPVAGMEFSFERGAHKVQVRKNSLQATVVNTHLEVGTEDHFREVQKLQVRELLRFVQPKSHKETVVLTGDLNASPEGYPGNPWNVLLENSYRDSWLENSTTSETPGYTCCQASNLRNPVSQLSERIDHILWKGSLNPVGSLVLGASESDQTEEGLWISDHAGVMTTFRIP